MQGMFTEKDEAMIAARGSHPADVNQQITYYRKGFPFLPVVAAAEAGNGILKINDSDLSNYLNEFDEAAGADLSILKFVPASGAASRMFKSLFSALEDLDAGKSQKDVLESNKDAREFYESIADFAFYDELKSSIENSKEELTFRNLLVWLLTGKGLNYGNLPKGLLLFHKYDDCRRTPFEEHLVEGAHYAKDSKGVVRLHFTVSPEHGEGFSALFDRVRTRYEEFFGVTYEVGFSRQKPSTDTIAVDLHNEPFREKDGSLLFRPGGHGALLENLNDLDSDLIFIKNIDNVVPDRLKEATYTYKKLLAGVLLHYQKHIFRFQKELNEKHHSALDSAILAEAAYFLENTLNTKPAENMYYTEKEDLYIYLREKYNRPIRVCGMVKNQGEPGGGPFWARNSDGTVSLQIAESVQIDHSNPVQEKIARHATHFNPVDLVCGIRNYKGEKFNLLNFRDPNTGFISQKSKDGRDLKAQELPGLWNGAMSDWNTLFVEVPIETFNPVKTVNDLLRDQHQ
jgi:hypothetical protein